ncbi:hypothetical protein [Streptomyces sp. NPDC093990]|uniref:hypothetical protein n=1 Tax=Streptomyces sp. NPDC093990 TaxID=3155306 RepID=UPI00341ADDA7
MTLWLRATVLAIVVGSSATVVLPQADRAYGTELTPRVPASAPDRRPADPFDGPLRGVVRTPAAATRPPASAPAVRSHSSRGHGPERASPPVSLAPSPSAATPSRAGSRAGEGRERPGRREEPATEEAESTDIGGTDAGDGDLTAVSEPPQETAVARPSRPAERPVAGPRVFILPLGTGLVLVGVGLGLGLFALRLRRG